MFSVFCKYFRDRFDGRLPARIERILRENRQRRRPRVLQSSLGALEHLVSGADGNILSREEGVAEGANSRGAMPFPPFHLGTTDSTCQTLCYF
jgi:hypothetical protein